MRIAQSVFALFAVCLCLVCQPVKPADAAAGGVALIDFARLIEDSKTGAGARTHIETSAQAMQEKLVALQGAGDTSQLQMGYAMYQEAVNALQEQTIMAFTALVSEVTEEVRASKGYDMVLTSEATVAHSPALNITDAVIAELDKRTIEYPTPEFDPSILMTPAEEPAEESAGAPAEEEKPAQ